MEIKRTSPRHLWSDLWSKSKETYLLTIHMECRYKMACTLSFVVKFMVKFPVEMIETRIFRNFICSFRRLRKSAKISAKRRK